MHRRFVKLINKNVRDSLFSENKPFCKISSSVFIESSEIFYGKNGRLNTTFLLKSMTLVDSLNWNKFHFCRQYCRHNQVRMNSKYFQGHFHPKTGKLEVKKKKSSHCLQLFRMSHNVYPKFWRCVISQRAAARRLHFVFFFFDLLRCSLVCSYNANVISKVCCVTDQAKSELKRVKLKNS